MSFIGFTSTRLGSKVSGPRTNLEDPVRPEPRTPGLRVKHFTTEPRRTFLIFPIISRRLLHLSLLPTSFVYSFFFLQNLSFREHRPSHPVLKLFFFYIHSIYDKCIELYIKRIVCVNGIFAHVMVIKQAYPNRYQNKQTKKNGLQ